jgi:hypothetical protein
LDDFGEVRAVARHAVGVPHRGQEQIGLALRTPAEASRVPEPVSTKWELAMRPTAILSAAALLLSGSGVAAAETGAFLLGNADRCGVADERVGERWSVT